VLRRRAHRLERLLQLRDHHGRRPQHVGRRVDVRTGQQHLRRQVLQVAPPSVAVHDVDDQARARVLPAHDGRRVDPVCRSHGQHVRTGAVVADHPDEGRAQPEHGHADGLVGALAAEHLDPLVHRGRRPGIRHLPHPQCEVPCDLPDHHHGQRCDLHATAFPISTGRHTCLPARTVVRVEPEQPTDPGALDTETLAFAHRMFDLARDGRSEELAAYVDAGVPANLTNDKGDTLLILAAYHGHPETVAALLARGADPARLNDRGQTALAAATFRRSTESVTALLDAGADPEQGGRSALATATFFELPEMMELLQRRRPV
jgi:hypothetical protein